MSTEFDFGTNYKLKVGYILLKFKNIIIPVQYAHQNLEYLDQPKVQLECRYCTDVNERLYPIKHWKNIVELQYYEEIIHF